jgi:hypothetical protein
MAGRSVSAVAYGGWVAELVTWYERDTMPTVAGVISEFRGQRPARFALGKPSAAASAPRG